MTEPGLQSGDLDPGSIPMLAALDAAALHEVVSSASRVHLPARTVLFREGDPGDALFAVLRGSLRVVLGYGTPGERTVDTIGSGALVGEMALLLDEPRSATVVARRDSELLRITRGGFDVLLSRHPRAATELARLLGQRLQRTTRRAPPSPRAQVIAFVAADAMARAALPQLQAAFISQSLSAVLLRPTDTPAYNPDEWEPRFRYVLLDADPSHGSWAQHGLRQADSIVVVASGDGTPFGAREMDRWPAECRHTPTELLLLTGAGREIRAGPWIETGRYRRHSAIRDGRDDDYQRVARRLSGRAVGVVLSGGGARGLAHIGVLQALAESGVPVDAIGGSSMGAIIAAEYAMGLDVNAMIAATKAAFVARQPFDLTLPVVSLTSAAGTVRRLRRIFGETAIEDLPIPYFCTSTNLSRAETVVHDRGPLWLATRVSCAIPGFAPPVTIGGDLLVDGGLLNNLPADVMRQRSDGLVIGVNVTPGVDLTTNRAWPAHMSGWRHAWERLTGAASPHPSILEILSRTALVGSMRDAALMAAHCDLYIQPDVDRFGMSDFAAIDALVSAGREAALAVLPAWRQALEQSSPSATV